MVTPDNIREAKEAIRRQVRVALHQISEPGRAAASARARALLTEQALWKTAQSILFFAPLPQELDVWPLLAEALGSDRQVLLPRFVRATRSYEACRIRNLTADLRWGMFGIREPGSNCSPVEFPRADLILVPGLAFDLQGRRLGRGQGFYDRLLATIRGVTCAVAFEEQIVAEIPVEAHDAHLDYVLTPERWVKVKR